MTRAGALAGRAVPGSLLAAFAAATLPLLAVPLTRPLASLADTLLLVLVLPPLAQALVALGWTDRLARCLALGHGLAWVLAPFALWLGLSALLTLDVAAVVAAPVALALAGLAGRGRTTQLVSAIVASNAGSLLFPFSNLTNLLLVAGTGVTFAAYLRASLAPQVAVVVVAALLLAFQRPERAGLVPPADPALARPHRDRAELVGGIVAIGGASAALMAGLAGGDPALVFAAVAALLVGMTVALARASLGRLLGSIPLAGVVVVFGAAIAHGPAVEVAGQLPGPGRLLPFLEPTVAAALVGGALAAAFNNLPAAAFGAVWLAGASPTVVVAYLVGTNVLAMLTPHGSLATVLCRSIAGRAGHPMGQRPYLRRTWRYALVPALAALVAIRLVG